MTKLTTHVLDVYSGKPGKGIKVELFYVNGEQRSKLNSIVLNADGRSEGPIIEKDNLGVNIFNPIEFSVYPNPSDNLLNIKVPIEFNGDYTLLNHLGQIAAKGTFIRATSIDISDLKSGIYYLELNDEKNNFKKAEIVKK